MRIFVIQMRIKMEFHKNGYCLLVGLHFPSSVSQLLQCSYTMKSNVSLTKSQMTFLLPRIISGLDSQQFRSNFYFCHVHTLHLYSLLTFSLLHLRSVYLNSSDPLIWVEPRQHYCPHVNTEEPRHRDAIQLVAKLGLELKSLPLNPSLSYVFQSRQ